MKFVDLTEAGFPPAGEVFELATFQLKVSEGSHPWALEHADAIESNWEREVAANPHLFNGSMIFQRVLAHRDGHVEGDANLIPYSAFLHWRRAGRPAGGYHLFSMPLIISRDGALMVIRMADTTANPGRVYPPAGSLDAADIIDGFCDLEGNMARETREETGLSLSDMEVLPGYQSVHADNTVAVFRRYLSPLTAGEMADRASAHCAIEAEPEISALFGIRSAGEIHDYPSFMPSILAWLFEKGMK